MKFKVTQVLMQVLTWAIALIIATTPLAVQAQTNSYRFESNYPGNYGRPPHIHLRVRYPGYEELITQHYPQSGATAGEFALVLQPSNVARVAPQLLDAPLSDREARCYFPRDYWSTVMALCAIAGFESGDRFSLRLNQLWHLSLFNLATATDGRDLEPVIFVWCHHTTKVALQTDAARSCMSRIWMVDEQPQLAIAETHAAALSAGCVPYDPTELDLWSRAEKF